MDLAKILSKRLGLRIGVLVIIFVAVSLIVFFVVDNNIDSVVEEQRRSMKVELDKFPELCEEHTSSDDCVDYWLKVLKES